MPEQGDGRVGTPLFNQFGQQGKMVILNKYKRAFCRKLRDNAFGKFQIHSFIHLPVRLPENRPGMGIMAKRPQAFVRKAVIVSLFFLFGQPYPL